LLAVPGEFIACLEWQRVGHPNAQERARDLVLRAYEQQAHNPVSAVS